VSDAPAMDEHAIQNRQDRKQAFVDAEPDSRIYASASLQTPRSAAQLMAGTLIPAALLTGINSDLPGQIIATVTEHVYDTVSGRLLLVPQGSRLLGQYDSQVAYGQSRVLLVWTRLVMPDGSSIVLDRLPGVDVAGQAGLEDDVDWHWDRIFAGAALSTLIGVGAELAAPDRDDGRIVVAGRDSVQEIVNEVGQQITRRNLNLQPTLTIRPGFPVRVIVNRDLVLRPYAG
jgi:type IV secretion system protein TrbI